MASSSPVRRSGRLRGLSAVQNPLGCCFICQEELDVHLISRCKRTECCGAFLHKPCYEQMMAQSPACGGCRRPNPTREIVLETDEEQPPNDNEDEDTFALPPGTFFTHFRLLAMYEIDEFHSSDRPHATHIHGSLFWNGLLYEFSPNPFYDFYNELKTLMNVYPGSDFYTHALVRTPVRVSRLVRHIVYHCFIYNIPDSMYAFMGPHRFRILFDYDYSLTNIVVSNLSVMTHGGGPTFYNEDCEVYLIFYFCL